MTPKSYVAALDKRYQTGIAREHSYRGDLQSLLQGLAPDVLVTNEPARIACGAPDYILTNEATGIDVAYIEAKDIGKSLDDPGYKEQFDRYRHSLPNLVITDYLEFRLYREGQHVSTVRIAEIAKGRIRPVEANFTHFETFVREFSRHSSRTITTALDLASRMAGKAKLLAQVIEAALSSDVKSDEDTSLKEQMEAFRTILIHDIDEKGFSDLYAQTIAYGMFSARLHDHSSHTFTRQEAAQLIPQTNPFLRKLFQYISGFDIDSRIEWIVNALAEVFRATDIKRILKDFGRSRQKTDPMIHFYETFLAEYDPELRKSRGVWYTPEPIVRFIVASIDELLKSEFGLSKGLADTSQVTIQVASQEVNSRTKKPRVEERQVHKVQILDPATGTGTFLAEVVKRIHGRFTGQKGIWSSYVEEHLIPRLNGFELLMASYAVAHLKLDLLLQQSGYKPRNAQRLHVYLTNSLEEHHPDTGTLFASWLSKEANEANFIKRDTPVMVVMGNPPYSRHSMNKGHWLNRILEDYKKEPGGHSRLKERNSKWLNDDYVKFIRHAQHFVDKSGYGIFGFITNHGYIDNPTFRGMRWSLLKSFDKIYVIDLHGNSNVLEAIPDGMANENVFDIKQGVAIIIGVKSGLKKEKDLATVQHVDAYGTRDEKYDLLDSSTLESIKFTEVALRKPFYFFRNKSYQFADVYGDWLSLTDIYKEYSTGYYTSCDDVVVGYSKDAVKTQVTAALDITFDAKRVRQTAFRPFDFAYVYYDEGIITRARARFVERIRKDNAIIITGKSSKNKVPDHFYISDVISELKCGESSKGSYMFPLWMTSKSHGDGFLETESNINDKVLNRYRKIVGSKVTPLDIHHYVYAVLYSPAYRAMFEESLKEDFARIPHPMDKESFGSLVALGERLHRLHTLEAADLDNLVTEFPEDGSNIISLSIGKNDWKISEDGDTVSVWINESQYFDGIPIEAWEFTVGGYAPAQKWLKDRKGVKLSFDDIIAYQRVIVALVETLQAMTEIDEIFAELLDRMTSPAKVSAASVELA